MLHALDQHFAGRRVLVVGGSGFLGKNVVHHLHALGAEVTATGTPETTPATSNVRWLGPLRFQSLFEARRAVASQEIVIDCIGKLGAAESNLHPTLSLEQELAPQLNLIVACTQTVPAPVFLFASSRLVYGAPLSLPVNEQHPLQPGSLYALHKLTAEGYLQVLATAAAMPFCIFRISNPYGPHQRLNAKGYGIINSFLRRAAHNQPIEIFGTGEQQRDYIHVDDVVQAMLRCAANSSAFGRTFNLGSGVGTSLRDVAALIRRLADSPPTRYRAWPDHVLAVETGDYISDLSCLRSVIGSFNPRALRDGLASCLPFYREEAGARLPPHPQAFSPAPPSPPDRFHRGDLP